MEPTVQKPTSHSTPKDFFLNLGAIVALYVLAGGFLSFVFGIINQLFPETVTYEYYGSNLPTQIKIGLSVIIVAFPILLVISRFIFKDLVANVEKREYALRRWLVYFTLFITGVTIAVDLIVLLNYFLDGEISARFMLKVLAVFVTAGLIFWYYITDLRGHFYSQPAMRKAFLWIISAIIVISVVGGFAVVGSPMTQRAYKADVQRVSDLSNIQWEIVNVYQQTGKLPASLADLNDPIRNYIIQSDPETGAPYEYRVISATAASSQFELCATFQKPTQDTKAVRSEYSRALTAGDNWLHGEGRTCFTRTIDPIRYPINRKTAPAVID